jgi:predicted nucleic acid-binding protein
MLAICGMETTDLDKVMVDTSAWINFFRKIEPVYSDVLKLFQEDRICCLGIVLAELIQGTRSMEEIKTLKNFLYVFSFLEESSRMWEKAGELSFSLKREGKTIGLSDCYVAVAANKARVAIYTLDEHFTSIKEHLDITLL